MSLLYLDTIAPKTGKQDVLIEWGLKAIMVNLRFWSEIFTWK